MVSQLKYSLANTQSTIGTAVALTSANYWQVSDLELEPNQMMDKVEILSGKFSSESQVVGNLNVNVKGKMPLVSKATNSAPECGMLLECAGFTASTSAVGGGTKYIYTRSITSKDMSISNVDSTSIGTTGIYENANSVMFSNVKLNLESGKVPMIDFTGVGLAGSSSTTNFTTSGSITKPTQTKLGYYSVNDVTATLLGTGYEVTKADFEFTNKINQKPTMTGYGFGFGQIADEESKFSCSTLVDTSMSVLPLNQVRSGATGTFTVTFGSITGRKVTITAPLAQITSAKKTKNGDLIASDLSGELLDNNVVITFNSDLV